jgi:hypothetical protein
VHFTLKLLWKDFNGEFEGALNGFRNHVKNVEKEAGVSNLIEASTERGLARAERAENERQRKSKFLIPKNRIAAISTH